MSSEILRGFHAPLKKVRPSLTIATLDVCQHWMWRLLTALCCRFAEDDSAFADEHEDDDEDGDDDERMITRQ